MEAMESPDGLSGVQAGVGRACELLIQASPESLDESSRGLEAATRALAKWRDVTPEGRGDPRTLAEVQQLRRNLDRAGRLLNGAFEFHLKWSLLLGAMCSGYTTSGEAAPVMRESRMSVRG